jgi:plasmid stabilization system protein ParE
MRLEFWPQADNDLNEIIGYFAAKAPGALAGIKADLEESFRLITEYPLIYPSVPGRPLRRHVSRKYRFKVTYRVYDDRIEIVGVFRFQNRDV